MSTIARPESSFLSTLPGRYYYDPTIYEQELEKIFSRLWVCVGRAEAIEEVGAYMTVQVGQENVIVVRGRDGTLRAFLNVCRHRGAQLCSEATGKLKGSIQCSYHAWTYGLDGRLIGAPNVLHDEQFDRMAFSLYPVALEVWEGMIWLNLADEPASIAAQLQGPIIERFGSYEPFARYDVGSLRVGKTIVYDVQANWKLLLENFQECYHCGPMHPELCQLLPAFRSGISDFGEGEAATFASGVEAFTMTGKASRPMLRGLSPEGQHSYYGIVLLPDMLINLLPDHVVVHTLKPVAPDRTLVTCDWLFDPQVIVEPNFDPMDAVELFDIVNRQDWEVCEMVQHGVRSKAFAQGGVYVPIERHIRAFADNVLEMLS
ncbi:MAG: aromatic ring-hydroxylating dioxygenase subunit alpha [Ktedonobacteraceae bacterium]